MTEPKAFASLTPTLLARKGGARPAMRPQLGVPAADPQARQLDDLGWNDMGCDAAGTATEPVAAVVSITPEIAVPLNPPLPEVVRQRAQTAQRAAISRRSALAEGRRAAFTLRLDAERHLRLRLACTLTNRSAQQLVTDAVDRLLAELPDVAELAAQVARNQP